MRVDATGREHVVDIGLREVCDDARRELVAVLVELSVGQPEERHVVVGEAEPATRFSALVAPSLVPAVGRHDDVHTAPGGSLASDGRATREGLVVGMGREHQRRALARGLGDVASDDGQPPPVERGQPRTRVRSQPSRRPWSRQRPQRLLEGVDLADRVEGLEPRARRA